MQVGYINKAKTTEANELNFRPMNQDVSFFSRKNNLIFSDIEFFSLPKMLYSSINILTLVFISFTFKCKFSVKIFHNTMVS